MPDMSKPGAHFRDTYETLKYKGETCRRDAATLTTRAEVYEEAASRLRDALDKEAARESRSGVPSDEH